MLAFNGAPSFRCGKIRKNREKKEKLQIGNEKTKTRGHIWMKLNPHPDNTGSALQSRACLPTSFPVCCRQEDLLHVLSETCTATKAFPNKMSKLTPACEGALKKLTFWTAWYLPAAATIWHPEAAGRGCGRWAGASPPPPAKRCRCRSVKPAPPEQVHLTHPSGSKNASACCFNKYHKKSSQRLIFWLGWGNGVFLPAESIRVLFLHTGMSSRSTGIKNTWGNTRVFY